MGATLLFQSWSPAFCTNHQGEPPWEILP